MRIAGDAAGRSSQILLIYVKALTDHACCLAFLRQRRTFKSAELPMAEKSSRESPQVRNPLITPGIALGMWGPTFTRALQLNAKAHEGFALITTEWQDFVGRRLKEDMSLVQRVATCKSPGQMWGAYAEFWQKAVVFPLRPLSKRRRPKNAT